MRVPSLITAKLPPREPLIEAIRGLQERLFWTPDGLQEYGELAQEVVLPADFEIHLLVKANNPAWSAFIGGHNFSLRRTNADIVEAYYFNGTDSVSHAIAVDDFSSLLRVSLAGDMNNLVLTVNGQSVTGVDSIQRPVSLKRFGRNAVSGSDIPLGNDYLPGVLADVLVVDRGIPKHFWPLGRADNLIEDKLNPLGANVWTNPTLGTQWTDNGDGNYTLVSDGAFNTLSVTIAEVSENYLIECDVEYHSGSNLTFRIDGTDSTLLLPGRNSFRKESNDAGSTAFQFVRSGNSDVPNVTVSNITVRQYTAWGEIKNPSANNKIKMREIEPRGDLAATSSLWPESLSDFQKTHRVASVITNNDESLITSSAETGEFWMRDARHADMSNFILSCEAAPGTNDFILLRSGGPGAMAIFNVRTGIVVTSPGVSASIKSIGSGFYLCSIEDPTGPVDYPSICMTDGVSFAPTLPAGETVRVRRPQLREKMRVAK